MERKKADERRRRKGVGRGEAIREECGKIAVACRVASVELTEEARLRPFLARRQDLSQINAKENEDIVKKWGRKDGLSPAKLRARSGKKGLAQSRGITRLRGIS